MDSFSICSRKSERTDKFCLLSLIRCFAINSSIQCGNYFNLRCKINQQRRKLAFQQFGAHLRLHTLDRLAFAGTVVVSPNVDITVLLRPGLYRGSDAHSTRALQQSAQRLGLVLVLVMMATLFNDRLHLVIQSLGNNRFVPSLVHFTAVKEMTVVEGIFQSRLDPIIFQHFAAATHHAFAFEKQGDLFQCLVAFGILFKGLPDNWRIVFVHGDGLGALVVQISQRGDTGENAIANFLAQPALGVLRQVIHIILALAEHNGEHKLALAGVFKPEHRKAQEVQYGLIKQVYELPAVNGITSQTVGMPSQNAVGLAALNPLHHRVEYRASGYFSRAFFYQLVNDNQIVVLGIFSQFTKLCLNGHNLFVLGVGGLARIQNVSFHNDLLLIVKYSKSHSVAHNSAGAKLTKWLCEPTIQGRLLLNCVRWPVYHKSWECKNPLVATRDESNPLPLETVWFALRETNQTLRSQSGKIEKTPVWVRLFEFARTHFSKKTVFDQEEL